MGDRVASTAAGIARQVRSGTVAPAEPIDVALATIAAREPKVRAFVSVRAEQASAEALGLARRPDLTVLPLAGVPVAVKDIIAVAGEPVRMGSLATNAEPSTADHPVVARLRAAGAIVVGLTALPELAVWATTDTPGMITRNPWNLARTPGGSSGGAAAAVAAGMVPIAHGTDGMGSIRTPAAACGVFGLKPGRGVVPSGVGTHSWFGMTENGPLATTVEDAALMLSVLADRPELAAIGEAGPLRVAVANGIPARILRVDKHWAEGLTRTVCVLERAGHRTADVTMPYLRALIPMFARWFAGVADDAAALDFDLLQPRTRRHVQLGRTAGRLRLIRQSQVDRLEERVCLFFDGYDVMLTPTLAQAPPQALRWSEKSWLSNMGTNIRYAPYAPLWNVLGWPAASVPVGIHPDSGTPLAVQIVAPPGGEVTILALAAQLERLQSWTRTAPG